MKQITQPTTLPEWFTQANINAKFSAKDIAELLNCSHNTIRNYLGNSEYMQGARLRNGGHTRKLFSKQTVLTYIKTLPTIATGEQS